MDSNTYIAGAIEPNVWFVVFYNQTSKPRLDRFIPGRFKHVVCFAYVPGVKVWVYVDAHLEGSTVLIFPHDTRQALLDLVKGATVVKFSKTQRPMPWHTRLGFSCVTMVHHLLGLEGVAFTPTGLYKLILRNGGDLIATADPEVADGPKSTDGAAAGQH